MPKEAILVKLLRLCPAKFSQGANRALEQRGLQGKVPDLYSFFAVLPGGLAPGCHDHAAFRPELVLRRWIFVWLESKRGLLGKSFVSRFPFPVSICLPLGPCLAISLTHKALSLPWV